MVLALATFVIGLVLFGDVFFYGPPTVTLIAGMLSIIHGIAGIVLQRMGNEKYQMTLFAFSSVLAVMFLQTAVLYGGLFYVDLGSYASDLVQLAAFEAGPTCDGEDFSCEAYDYFLEYTTISIEDANQMRAVEIVCMVFAIFTCIAHVALSLILYAKYWRQSNEAEGLDESDTDVEPVSYSNSADPNSADLGNTSSSNGDFTDL